MGHATYEASDTEVKKAAYYEGTDTLKEGMPLCFNHDTTAGATSTSVDWNRGWRVEKPATANLMAFAGLVAKGHGGKTGPCAIELEIPTAFNRCVLAYTDQACTAGTTKLALAGSTYALGAAGAATKVIGEALQTVDRSSTAGTVLMKYGGTPMVAVVTPTCPALTGGTTGGTVGIAGTTTGAPTDVTRLASAVVCNKTDIAAIINRMKQLGHMDVS